MTSSLMETFDMNSKAYFTCIDASLEDEVKQHQRSAGYNSDIVSIFFLLKFFCAII